MPSHPRPSRLLFAAIALCVASTPHVHADTARGYVFDDQNRNGVMDPHEDGVGNVGVSNGRDVVATDVAGAYEIDVDDDDIVFVIKPRNYALPLDELNKPRFFYVHKPNGSPTHLEFPGVPPTGPLPERIDFPLHRSPEPDSFRVILFGDPQPYDIDQVNEYAHDVVEEVVGELRDPDSPAFGAAFGVSLGDLVGDDLDLFTPLNQVTATVGIPWINVYGNHDMNFDVTEDRHADETFERVYGPPTYAFEHGPIRFIVVDNVYYEGQTEDRPKGSYRAELTEDIDAFLRNLRSFRTAGGPKRTVLLMHIPLYEHEDYAEIIAFGGIDLSIAAHWHRHMHLDLPVEFEHEGQRHDLGHHHHMVAATTSGSWWQGAPDEFGLPHAMMRDGRPNGWCVLDLTVDRARLDYSVRFKAARRPWDHQMHLHLPSELALGEVADATLIANVYNDSMRSTAEFRVSNSATGDASAWRPMERFRGVDPYWAALKEAEASDHPPRGRTLTNLDPETDLWRASLPPNLRPGPHLVEVRATDHFGHLHHARRILRVTE
jgi:hypothetical protein